MSWGLRSALPVLAPISYSWWDALTYALTELTCSLALLPRRVLARLVFTRYPSPRRDPDGEPHTPHGSLFRKSLDVLYQAQVWPWHETTGVAPCTPNQPQCELFLRLSESTVNLFRPIFAVFHLPDELILHILSFVSPDWQLTGHFERFHLQYLRINTGHHRLRVQFLVSLSMTCKAMRLRLLSWIWERLEHLEWCPGRYTDQRCARKFHSIARTLSTNRSLATNVKYISTVFCP